MVRKLYLLVCLIVLFFFAFADSPLASSFVVVDSEGKVIVNVLAEEASLLSVPEPAGLDVKNLADQSSGNRLISLAKNGNDISLKVGDEKSFDVTNWKDNLVEVEEKENVKKVVISLKDGHFVISQEGFTALTDFPIQIDPRKNRFIIGTPSGEKYLAILPYDAVQSALRSKAVTTVDPEPLKITEEEKDLSYLVAGKKSLNIFNVYNLTFAVEAKVSASTGEILSTNEPAWLKVLSFFLT
jgi:hypothetical protein